MEKVALCAQNNADLYRLICSAHDVASSVSDGLLVIEGTPPRYYSRAVTLKPDSYGSLAVRGILEFKDSFNDVDGARLSAIPLFTANWIWRDPSSSSEAVDPAWRPVSTEAELTEWEAAWAAGDEGWSAQPTQFPASLLRSSAARFLAKYFQGKIVAGALLNRSSQVVGVSNVFSSESDPSPWSDIVRMAQDFAPGFPLVGYERGCDLDQALSAGFEIVGPLTIWVKPLASDPNL